MNSRTRAAKKYKALGKCLTIRQWSEETGIGKEVIGGRIRRGWTVEQAVTTPRGRKKLLDLRE